LFHDRPFSPDGPHGETSTDDLAQAGKVRIDAAAPRVSSPGKAEARDDFVKDEEAPVRPCELPQSGKKSRLGRDHPHIAGGGFDDDGGDFRTMLGKDGGDRPGIVEGEGNGEFGQASRHTGTVGNAQGGHAGTGPGQEGIAVAVITAGKLDDPVPAGEGPGQADGRHDRLRSRTHHPEHFQGGKGIKNHPGQFHFKGRRGAEAAPLFSLCRDRRHDRRVGVTENQGTPGHDIIDVFIAVHVAYPRAPSGVNEDRCPAHGLEGPHRTVDPSGDKFCRLGK